MGEVSAAGFRAATTTGTQFIVREGRWTPIQVKLTAQGTTPFQGALRFESPDLDGDLVSYIETPVTVTFDAPRRAWVYARCPMSLSGFGTVDILSDDGLLLSRLNMPAWDAISDDTLLVLDVSARPITGLRRLQTPGWTPLSPGYGARPYYQNVKVATLPATELPDRWIGLEAVDVVIWDEPNPAAVGIAQLKALEFWVRRGGRLVLGLGATWRAVEQSELAEWIPVRSTENTGGATREVEALEQFFEHFVARSRQTPAREQTFDEPVSLARVEARPGALQAFRSRLPGGGVIDLITKGWVDSGRVTAVAASLRDLVSEPVNDAFYAQLLDITPLTDAFREAESEAMQFALGVEELPLRRGVTAPTTFAARAGLLVLAAFAFVVAYIGVATFATWWWLRRHSLATHAWSAFAAIAVVASVLSLGTVSVTRGISRGVKMSAHVDLEAGSSKARVRCFAGYSSPILQRVRLSLPGADAFLRPLAVGRGRPTPYATPMRYAAYSSTGLLDEVPMRATLKQFEGCATTQIDGALRAALVADRATGHITPTSWIENGLGGALGGGYLLYIDPRFSDADAPAQPGGQTTNWWGWEDVPAAMNVLAVRLGPFEAGEKMSGLGQAQYEEHARDLARWLSRGNDQLEDRPDLLTLRDVQDAWIQPGLTSRERGLSETARHSLLAATRRLYLHAERSDRRFDKVNNRPITVDGLMDLDVTHWLMHGRVKAGDRSAGALAGQAVLLVFAESSGPVALRRDDEALSGAGGFALYRVRVPLQYTGRPPMSPREFEP